MHLAVGVFGSARAANSVPPSPLWGGAAPKAPGWGNCGPGTHHLSGVGILGLQPVRALLWSKQSAPPPTGLHKGRRSASAQPAAALLTSALCQRRGTSDTLPVVGRGGAGGVGLGECWAKIMPHSAIEPRTRRQAQSLRHRTTDAERKLWRLLRSLKPLGFHFRRQAPIGPYIPDFVWYAGTLVIEIDGGQHAELRRERDEQRTAWLETQGFQVLRFWNNDVLKSVAAVGEVILAAAGERHVPEQPKHPTPDPSPQGGGERTGASGNSIKHRARPNRLDASAKRFDEKNRR